jgi:hypothetical protein
MLIRNVQTYRTFHIWHFLCISLSHHPLFYTKFCWLFNGAFCSIVTICALNVLIFINELGKKLEGSGRELMQKLFRLSQNSRCLFRNSNPVPPERESVAFSLGQLVRSCKCIVFVRNTSPCKYIATDLTQRPFGLSQLAKKFKAFYNTEVPLQYSQGPYFVQKLCTSDRLCGLVVRVLGYRSRGPGSIPGTTKFSEK